MQVASYWLVSILMTNCWTCLRNSNKVVRQFGVKPLSIEEYLLQDEQFPELFEEIRAQWAVSLESLSMEPPQQQQPLG